MYINKKNLIISLAFICLTTVIVRHIFNNLTEIVRLDLTVLYVMLVVIATLNAMMAIYFFIVSWERK